MIMPDMVEKKIVVTERIGVPRFGEFVRVGVPFAKGELLGVECLTLLSPEREIKLVQASPLNHWADGSIKWALCDFAATVPAGGTALYCLAINRTECVQDGPAIRITRGADIWQVDTGETIFSVNAREFRPFVNVTGADGAILSAESNCTLLTAEGTALIAKIESIVVETEGILRSVLAVQGHFAGKGGNSIRFSSRLHFFAGSSCVQFDFTIHNPRSAQHSGGLWDLGDSGSLIFKELAFEFRLPEARIKEILCSPEAGSAMLSFAKAEEGLELYQESSGGENWRSPVHRTRNGVVPFTLRGYKLRSGEKKLTSGLQATPLFWCGSGSSGFAAALPRFWQEFPKSIKADSRSLTVALFPACSPDFHELQGGEQKTHRVYLDFAVEPHSFGWSRAPLTVAASPEVVQLSAVIADLPFVHDGKTVEKSLVEQFISGPEEFLRKREAVDEFGWRNFGELYADHEAVKHQGAEPFVSHYNNQYDPCAGMYRMFLATGKPLWGELASDLAQHVIDIDIYHTTSDREEYNNGLFWHTDHYVAAGLATHRSFSQEQIGSRDPRYCGSGPGAEHCYTTGLMLHYFLSGEQDARNAVVGLAEWCYRSLSGSQTILATIKNALRYLSMLRGADKNNPPVFPRFPLTRGAGNAITACIDAFEVSGDRKFLDRAEEMIRGALHPDDDMDARDLLNAEYSWSYTVLLVSVVKYLNKKRELEQFDAGFKYARASLLAYAEWMLVHEYLYLEKPEILEYPNETWPAQDLRKSVIFYYAAVYSSSERSTEFRQRGGYFYKAAAEELAKHASIGFTRPVALMLQNDWVGSHFDQRSTSLLEKENVPKCTLSDGRHPVHGLSTPYITFTSVKSRVCSELISALRTTNLQKELAWLKARLG
jgi:hypothetical protein